MSMELLNAAQSLLAVTCYADSGKCAICHAEWPGHYDHCQGQRLTKVIEDFTDVSEEAPATPTVRVPTNDEYADGFLPIDAAWLSTMLPELPQQRHLPAIRIWERDALSVHMCGHTHKPDLNVYHRHMLQQQNPTRHQFRFLCLAVGVPLPDASSMRMFLQAEAVADETQLTNADWVRYGFIRAYGKFWRHSRLTTLEYFDETGMLVVGDLIRILHPTVSTVRRLLAVLHPESLLCPK